MSERVAWSEIKIGQSFRFWGSSQSGFRYIKVTEAGFIPADKNRDFCDWTSRGFQQRPSDEVYEKLNSPEWVARSDYHDLLLSCIGWLLVRDAKSPKSPKKSYLVG
jgi:hypothetical protein